MQSVDSVVWWEKADADCRGRRNGDQNARLRKPGNAGLVLIIYRKKNINRAGNGRNGGKLRECGARKQTSMGDNG